MTDAILTVAEMQAEADTHRQIMAIRRAARIEAKRQARETVAARFTLKPTTPPASASASS
ncbi:hypothetical protein [Methylobacterium oryzae]|uniref:hypothetical protein n=1 Tax=Methylobacterium oryzae TaxID=334852 RepID=UPI001F235777|nr:hypothetical protein [Methylobacterium oryzae]UIN36392.1 hypothetical protein LXM90_07815 [Methylobacterium oryzae]